MPRLERHRHRRGRPAQDHGKARERSVRDAEEPRRIAVVVRDHEVDPQLAVGGLAQVRDDVREHLGPEVPRAQPIQVPRVHDEPHRGAPGVRGGLEEGVADVLHLRRPADQLLEPVDQRRVLIPREARARRDLSRRHAGTDEEPLGGDAAVRQLVDEQIQGMGGDLGHRPLGSEPIILRSRGLPT